MENTVYRNKLSIIILSPIRMAILGAGDWVQAYNTANGLRELGHDVYHFIWGKKETELQFPNTVHIENLESIPLDVDVIHFIPAPSRTSNYLQSLQKKRKRPLLVASTIFWDSLIHRKICALGAPIKLNIAKYHIRKIFPFVSRSYSRFMAFDLLLPNSFLEIQNVKNYFKISPRISFGKVPNAINAIPDWAVHSELPDGLNEGEYIVYPGVFSPRKNQLGFIRAIRDYDYKIVFVGGPLPNRISNQYFEQCRKEASDSCYFLGQLKNGSDLFYGALRGARVACLASSCETPGIALLEASSLGARPAMTCEGSGAEYFGFDAEYFDPLSKKQLINAIEIAYRKGRLSENSVRKYRKMTWKMSAEITEFYYFKEMERIDSSEKKGLNPRLSGG